ncbi:MAG TPA: GIY-YIG nuclease family protein, partial [Candidatus Methylomirabilis sp.]|nr:GIY-YIG nuclease family protein [Candidatus Methylomirabilis sp.]
LNSRAVYAGKCIDLAKRWGGMGYGAISPKNCFVGGQSTNCKVNHRIYEHLRRGDRLELWFHATAELDAFESHLIRALQPPWNSQVPW